MEAVFFRHTMSSDPAYLGERLKQAGFSLRMVDCWCDDLSAFDAVTPDLLVVMGGAPGVYQADIYPFLKDEMKIIEKRIKANKPMLGVCLGAQLTAATLGARVYKGDKGTEYGWFPVHVTEEGKNSAAAVYDAPQTLVMQCHGDTFDLPQGATLLAKGELYPHQIFSYGSNVVVFQPHIEVSDALLKEWFVEDAGDAARGHADVPRMRVEAAKNLPALNKATASFVDSFLKQTGLTGRKAA